MTNKHVEAVILVLNQELVNAKHADDTNCRYTIQRIAECLCEDFYRIDGCFDDADFMSRVGF